MADIYYMHQVPVTEDEKKEIEARAAQDGVTVNKLMRLALAAFFERNKHEASEHVDG